MEDDAGVERARPRPHAEPVERREAERAVHAFPFFQGAQTRAAPQVGDDDAPPGKLRRFLPQDGSDVLVREAVETVPLYAGLAYVARKRDQFRDRRLAAVEARVEAGDLRHVR